MRKESTQNLHFVQIFVFEINTVINEVLIDLSIYEYDNLCKLIQL